MKNKGLLDESSRPLLYCKTDEEIAAYRRKPVEDKFMWLQAQMEFFHEAMSEKSKRIREKIKRGEI